MAQIIYIVGWFMNPEMWLTVAVVIFTAITTVIGYLLSTRDKQRQVDIVAVQDLIKETAQNVLAEKDKTAALVLSENRITAALVLSENRMTAALVLSEKEKLAAIVKAEHDRLEEKFTAFRIKVAEEYTSTVLLEKITGPLLDKLNEIEKMLHAKVDRIEFEEFRKTEMRK